MTQSILNMPTPLHRHLSFFNSKAANARPHSGASRYIQNRTMEIKIGTLEIVCKLSRALLPDSRNTMTFHKYFWCSRFCEFHSKRT